MKVSIAMATYNGAQFLEAQLQSFMDQTRQPDELVITDDCSRDETEVIVREFIKKATFKVEYYRNDKNLGYCGNFNEALARTTGGLVFLSDQDDVWFPEKIEYMLGVAEWNPEALVLMNDAALTDGALNEVGLTKIGQIQSAGFSMDNFVMGCCCAVRRELLNICLPILEGFKAHDNWIVDLAEALNAKIVDTKVLQYYRRHESNESQFIANRITQVTKMQVFIQRVKALLKRDAIVRTQFQLEQRLIYAQGIIQAKEQAPQKYVKQLIELEKHVLEQVEVLKNRIYMQEEYFIKRILLVIFFLVRGGYKGRNTFKSVLKDVFG